MRKTIALLFGLTALAWASGAARVGDTAAWPCGTWTCSPAAGATRTLVLGPEGTFERRALNGEEKARESGQWCFADGQLTLAAPGQTLVYGCRRDRERPGREDRHGASRRQAEPALAG